MKNVINLRDIALSTHIGVPLDERATAQTLLLDIELHHERTDLRDDITATYDYYPLAEQVYALAGGTRKLIETLAEEVLALAFVDSRITYAKVTVHKPSALKNGIPSVTIEAYK